MGLLSFIAGPPLAPVRGVISLAELIQRQVEEWEDARAAGEISAEEEQAQQAILDRMTGTALPSSPERE
ncbi:gas vesicle protein G [Rhodococcus sp. NPDC057014]|uniref:gas vesicle protein G n=1 Tax=unclassified Rhodococcus (in: high G+C Gram-positive bacteria) TaxID=192944 RepID=UPI0036252FA3